VPFAAPETAAAAKLITWPVNVHFGSLADIPLISSNVAIKEGI
jgi:hypothetical protein